MRTQFYARSALALSVLTLASPALAQRVENAGAPFGMLPLIDEIDTGDTGDAHPMVQGPANASRVETVLGRSARVLAPAPDGARMVAYRIGAGRGLVAGRAYLLVVEYPDDVPRTITVVNRGADQQRTFATGAAIGDYREQYTYPNPESLRYPHSAAWQQYRTLFYLHDRFQPLVAVRNESDTRRPDGPAQGFWVGIGQFSQRGNPRERGAAVGRIRLFEVPDPSRFDLAVNYPPDGLPRRHVFWREEMNDGPALCLRGDSTAVSDPSDPRFATACNPATATPVTWLEYKMRLARFLGINTFTKDLLEFGHNQGWDASSHGGPAWYAPSRVSSLWGDAVASAGRMGLEVLPYFEYAGGLGGATFTTTACPSENAAGDAVCAAVSPRHRCQRQYSGGTSALRCALPTLGYQRRCHPLAERNEYTGFGWLEDKCVDVTDPETLTDARYLLDATVLRLRDRAPFVGAWFRSRYTQMPVSFSQETLERVAREANGGAAVTRAQLRATPALLDRYYAWWYRKRREFFAALRDYLRSNGVPDATVLFTSFHDEPLPTRFDMDRVATDDTAGWATVNTGPAPWQFRYPPENWDTFVSSDRFGRSITELTGAQGIASTTTSYAGEVLHSAPPADPDGWRDAEGLVLTMPFGRLFSVARPELFERFRSRAGLALVRHFPLNEDDGHGNEAADRANGSFNNWPMSGRFGYFVSDVDRAGPHAMLAEARSVANGDPTYLGYLASSSFSRGEPEYVRAFHAAYLALPALASAVVAGASSDPAVVVRELRTPRSGTYYAVVNTAMETKRAVRVTLPARGLVRNAATNESLTGTTFDLYSGQLLALRVTDETPPPVDAGLTDASPADVAATDVPSTDVATPRDGAGAPLDEGTSVPADAPPIDDDARLEDVAVAEAEPRIDAMTLEAETPDAEAPDAPTSSDSALVDASVSDAARPDADAGDARGGDAGTGERASGCACSAAPGAAPASRAVPAALLATLMALRLTRRTSRRRRA